MKVVILCGGQGSRLREETETKPKPMIEIGRMPILWHIMKTYAYYGHKDFILCLGYKGEMIRRFFYEYELVTNDCTIELGHNNIVIHPKNIEEGWKVTLVDTGLDNMTGSRVKQIEKYIDEEDFLLTYGDGVTDLDINKLVEYHKSHKKFATVTGVTPTSQYGELIIEDNKVVSFAEKPKQDKSAISGGYFVFNKKVFEYIDKDISCILEKSPIQKLVQDGQLNVYKHSGFWQCMDTYRDYKFLKQLWNNGLANWKVW